MAKPLRIEITNDLKFDEYFTKWEMADKKARGEVGLQLLNWIVNGSSRSSKIPPVLSGLLRGSGSAFVGSNFIGATPPVMGKGEPNQSHTEKKGVITVGFNTDYAARWHENPFKPGPVSSRDRDVGYKYIEEHLKADGQALIDFYAKLIKKGTNG